MYTKDFRTDYEEIKYNGQPIRVTPDGHIAATDLAKALGYSKQQFYMMTSKNPDLLRNHLDTYRFDRRGPAAQVLDYAGARTYLDRVSENNPEALKLARTIAEQIEAKRTQRDQARRREKVLAKAYEFISSLEQVPATLTEQYVELKRELEQKSA